jgi:hypothetical protein
MPAAKVRVPKDVKLELVQLQQRAKHLEERRALAENTLRDYVTDMYQAGNGSYGTIAEVLDVSKAWVAQLVTEVMKQREADGDPMTLSKKDVERVPDPIAAGRAIAAAAPPPPDHVLDEVAAIIVAGLKSEAGEAAAEAKRAARGR